MAYVCNFVSISVYSAYRAITSEIDAIGGCVLGHIYTNVSINPPI